MVSEGKALTTSASVQPPRAPVLVLRHSAMLAVGMIAVVVVGLSSYRSATTAQDGMNRLFTADKLISSLQEADGLIHTLRTEALSAAGGEAEARHHAAEEIAEHAEEARVNATERERIARAVAATEPGLAASLPRLEQNLERFVGEAERLTRLAGTDPRAATRAVAEFEDAFELLDEELGRASEHSHAAAQRAFDRTTQENREGLTWAFIAIGAALVLMLGLGVVVLRDVRRTIRTRHESDRHQFAAELHSALEMVTTEDAAHDVVARAMTLASGDRPAELLLADSSRASLTPAAAAGAGAPGCPVSSPAECVAVRRGHRAVFDSSENLAACPSLRDRPEGARSAVCIPVTFMGRNLGVLHSTGPDGTPPQPDLVERLTTVADQAGNRIGTLRAFSQSELRAATDGLTGLLNRRSLEDRIRLTAAPGTRFAVVMADLDRFKQLNDTHGHDAGDRALRLFAAVVKRSIRTEDVAGRYGGEEFVMVFPGLDAIGALPILERLRSELGGAGASGAIPAFTASFGVADSNEAEGFTEALELADSRLRSAKQQGRDRVVATTGAVTVLAQPRPDPQAPAPGPESSEDRAPAAPDGRYRAS
jgi:diguanylate cyclase (GGDEF)-like protein